MKTCFVSIPYGVKPDLQTGIPIDFDIIYRELIEPAIAATSSRSFRIDDVADLISMQKVIIESLITSDIVIADLTTNNPNVMYELGIRHMARRGLTIMICSSGTKIPANISGFRVLSYELNADGSVAEKSKFDFQRLLRYAIESSLETTVTDSPVYEFFPDLSLSLPVSISSAENKKEIPVKRYKRSLGVSTINKVESIESLKQKESDALNEASDVDPNYFLSLLKKYRDMSAWRELVALAEQVPDDLKKNPDVQQLYALSLNRIGEQDKAISVISHLIEQTGGDAESYGVLGRIYKDKYENAVNENPELASAYLDQAIANYRMGFEKQPDDYYTGVNVVNLLLLQNTEAARADLKSVLPRVQQALNNKMVDSIPDYWIYATALELFCIAGDWSQAERQVELALDINPNGWMIETTLKNLAMLRSGLPKKDLSQLERIIERMSSRLPEGSHHA